MQVSPISSTYQQDQGAYPSESILYLFNNQLYNIKAMMALPFKMSLLLLQIQIINLLNTQWFQNIQFKEKQMQKDESGIPEKFMIFPNKSAQIRQAYLKPKTLQQINAVSQSQRRDQFEYLSNIDFPDEVFQLKNQQMNRYCDIFAYKHSRVKVESIPNYYINANQVKSLHDGKVFTTFSQAPVAPFDNMWEAIYYKKIEMVAMLCSFYDPKRGHQAKQYWPGEKEQVKFSKNSLTVTHVGAKELDTDFVESMFKIQGPEGERIVRHLHWTGWSDLKKPAQGKMKPFQFLIEECLKYISENKPFIIHCSAGIGRTGTLGGIIDGIRYFKENKKISIYAIVQNMRKYRYYAVQTFEQYNFMYEYLKNNLM